MKEEATDGQIGDMLREFDPVPETPVDEIWAGITAARRYSTPVRRYRGPSLLQGLSMAATLIIGIGIGRFQASTAVLPAAPGQESTSAETAVEFSPAATDYLARTQALLTAFPTGAREGRTPEVASWARQLLLDTRLLLDSPATSEAELAPLLGDLELILAQIAALRSRDDQGEIELIENGIAQNQVLARLRLAAGAAAGAYGDD